MNLEEFNRTRRPAWQRLRGLLDRTGARPDRLDADGIVELGRLHRECSADLAFARRSYPGDPLLGELELLVLRARNVVYRERVRGGSLRGFLSSGYWRAVRERPVILAIAALATLLPALLAATWAAHDPGAAIGLLPRAYRAGADPHVRHLPGGLASGAGLASSIYTNNLRVSFVAFAGGLLCGAGTLAVLAYNGLLLGALAGLSIQAGTFSVFVRFVAPHGLLELSCFTVAGLAGLRLAEAIVDPGVLARSEALRRRARGAVTLVLGTVPWLVLAGLCEGFVTPHGLPLGAALAVGGVLAALFWGLVAVLGRPLTAGSVTSPAGRPARSGREASAEAPR
ncbi:MAG: stage II sporulation protein M [Solirubrobacteraceae bacterium]